MSYSLAEIARRYGKSDVPRSRLAAPSQQIRHRVPVLLHRRHMRLERPPGDARAVAAAVGAVDGRVGDAGGFPPLEFPAPVLGGTGAGVDPDLEADAGGVAALLLGEA